jgi:aspartyl-tRNA synthetase
MYLKVDNHLLKEIKGIEVDKFPRMTYEHAMKTTEMTNQTFVLEWSLEN